MILVMSACFCVATALSVVAAARGDAWSRLAALELMLVILLGLCTWMAMITGYGAYLDLAAVVGGAGLFGTWGFLRLLEGHRHD